MKKILMPATACLLLIAVLSVNSCRKTDILCDPRNGNAEFTKCVIHQINSFPNENATVRTFTYNSRRDPVIGEPGFVATGSPRWVFYYDTKGRLVTFAGLYIEGTSFEFWHNYKYDSKDRIISDSTYFFGLVGHLGEGPGGWRHSQLFYDNLNRIVKESVTSSDIFTPPYTNTYFYDAAGNLYGNGTPYDNKANLLLTNKIWRFLARDYSVNNRTHASAYNANGLPTLFTDSNGDYFNPFPWQIYGYPVNIIYDCGDDHDGHY